MVKLIVPRDLFRKMEDHALSAYPEEGCGLLIGEIGGDFGKDGSELDVSEIRPLANAWDARDRTHRYEIDPDELARVEKELFGTGRGVLGLYHSHPDEPAWPSPFDLDRAWPHYAYLILSIKRGWLVEARAWRLDERPSHVSDGRAFVEIAVNKSKEERRHESGDPVAHHPSALRRQSGSRRR